MADAEQRRSCRTDRAEADDEPTQIEIQLRARAGLALYLVAVAAIGGALLVEGCLT